MTSAATGGGDGAAHRPRQPPPDRVGLPGRPTLSRGLARLMRPVLSDLTAEIADEISLKVFDYGPHSGSLYLTSTRLATTQAVHYFVDHLADASAPRAELDEMMRRIGRGEAYEGRTLEALRKSFSIGADIAWRRINAMALRQSLSPQVIGDLSDDLYAFMDSLAHQSAMGYHEAQAQLSDAAHQWRVRVLDLILAGLSAPAGELAAHAAAGNWPIPDNVAMVAVRRTPGIPLPSARMFHPSTLASLHTNEPVVLMPAPMSTSLHGELAALFVGHRIAIGCAVPVADARSSLRWARRVLDLVDEQLIADAPIIDCAEHISTLWIHSEPLLSDIVCRTVLAPLFAEPPNSRRILGETLLAWIETARGSAPVLAELLGRHPQTVRYRLKRLRELFGDDLDNPARVLEMNLALRVSAPQWNTGHAASDIKA